MYIHIHIHRGTRQALHTNHPPITRRCLAHDTPQRTHAHQPNQNQHTRSHNTQNKQTNKHNKAATPPRTQTPGPPHTVQETSRTASGVRPPLDARVHYPDLKQQPHTPPPHPTLTCTRVGGRAGQLKPQTPVHPQPPHTLRVPCWW
jgi:hypothetical protein